jgi:antitoxin component YwqK of YwqJK toxin-antitoxin module
MWLKQTLRWCTITGALMLATVCATYLHKQVAADPQGVETRWWDGTKKFEETYHSNGKVMTRTEYGDDGKTIITYREYDWEGRIQIEKIRLKSGNVEENQYLFDGSKNVLISYTLWMGDQQKFLITRMFWSDGSMRQEVVNTDDGLIPRHSRMWDRQGRLIQENQILQNAANQHDEYKDGKLAKRQTLFGTGDLVVQMFRPDGTISKEEKVIKLSGNAEHTYFDDKGKAVFGGEVWPDGTEIFVLYKNGVLAIKHTATPDGQRFVEELNGDGKVTRKLVFDANGRPSVVYLYRGDGTLGREKHLRGPGNDTKVVKQLDYDATGKKVVAESDSGDSEKFDADVLEPPAVRGSILRGLQR